MNWRVSGRTPPTRTASSSRSRRGVSFYRRGSVGAVLARRIYLGSDAYSDARGLYWLRGNRADLQVDCSAAPPLQQAELLEVRDRGLVLGDLRPPHRPCQRPQDPPDDAGLQSKKPSSPCLATPAAEARSPRPYQTPRAASPRNTARITTTIGAAIPTLTPMTQPSASAASGTSGSTTSATPTNTQPRRCGNVATQALRPLTTACDSPTHPGICSVSDRAWYGPCGRHARACRICRGFRMAVIGGSPERRGGVPTSDAVEWLRRISRFAF